MLEKLLEALLAHTKALEAHTAALLGGSDTPKTTRGKKATDTPPAGAAAQPTATAATSTLVGGTPQPVQNAAAASQPSAAAAVSPQSAGDMLVKVANELEREVAVQVLAMFGAKAFSGVKPESYVAFKDALDKAMAAGESFPRAAVAGQSETVVAQIVDNWLASIGLKPAKAAPSGAAGLM